MNYKYLMSHASEVCVSLRGRVRGFIGRPQLWRRGAGIVLGGGLLIAFLWTPLQTWRYGAVVMRAKEVEQANARFFEAYGTWPHLVTGRASDSLLNTLVLADPVLAEVKDGPVVEAKRNFLPGFEVKTDDGPAKVMHGLGTGPILQGVRPFEDGTMRLTITLYGLSQEQAEKADRAIDATPSPVNGRIRYEERKENGRKLYDVSYAGNVVAY